MGIIFSTIDRSHTRDAVSLFTVDLAPRAVRNRVDALFQID